MENTKFNLLGYSQKMYSRIRRKKILFALSIVVLVLSTPLLYTVLTDEYVVIPAFAPYLLGVILSVFSVILIMTMGKNHESTFQGEIFKKEVAKLTRKSGRVTYNSRIWVKDVNGYHTYYDLYQHKKEKNAGKNKQFEYYRVGDTIRKIYGLRFPEKLVKTDDEMVICVKCGKFNDHTVDRCKKCHFPMMK